jgi:hypothetical protein
VKFTRFTPTPSPVNISDPLYTGVLESNFSALEASINYIGQDLESFINRYLTFVCTSGATAGQLCYLDTSGGMSLCDASAEATCSTLLGIAKTDIAAGATGKFMLKGIHETTGLPVGSVMYADTTAGDWTYSSPGVTGEIVRIIGYALSTTQLFFEPDRTWTEIQ